MEPKKMEPKKMDAKKKAKIEELRRGLTLIGDNFDHLSAEQKDVNGISFYEVSGLYNNPPSMFGFKFFEKMPGSRLAGYLECGLDIKPMNEDTAIAFLLLRKKSQYDIYQEEMIACERINAARIEAARIEDARIEAARLEPARLKAAAKAEITAEQHRVFLAKNAPYVESDKFIDADKEAYMLHLVAQYFMV